MPSCFSLFLLLLLLPSAGETLIGSNSVSIRGASSYHSLPIDPIGEIEFGAGGRRERRRRKKTIDQTRSTEWSPKKWWMVQRRTE